ncbi:MAG: hypothetical protein LAP85_08395 [Acidobacteriia bacterium]|nr:hypothetical protein [Terriglobia bacterium]
MDELTFRGWTVKFDFDATRSEYSKAPIGAAEQCGCLECQNFIAARNLGLVYPDEIIRLFHTLGIDVARECELYSIGKVATGRHEYGGWFDVVGRIIRDENQSTEITADFELIPVVRPGPFTPSQGFPEPSFRLEFQVNVPWVLNR